MKTFHSLCALQWKYWNQGNLFRFERRHGSELTVDNLGLYKIDQLSVDGCQMTMKLANSRLRINGFYTVEGIFQGMTIFAHGPLELAAHQLTLNGSATLAKRGDSGEIS